MLRPQLHPDQSDIGPLLERRRQRRRCGAIYGLADDYDHSVMGEFTIGYGLKTVGWVATLAMVACVIGMAVTRSCEEAFTRRESDRGYGFRRAWPARAPALD
jgi:hypothetical protein